MLRLQCNNLASKKKKKVNKMPTLTLQQTCTKKNQNKGTTNNKKYKK